MLALTAGCSSEPSLREQYPVQWKTCDDLFGVENMETVHDMFGDDQEILNPPITVDEVADGLKHEARERYDKVRGFDDYDVCHLFDGRSVFWPGVGWSARSLKQVSDPSGRWHPVGPDAFVNGGIYGGGSTVTVFRCEVAGAAKGRQVQILLEVSLNNVGHPATDEFEAQLVAKLAQSVRDAVGCVNRPEIPEGLSPTKA